MIVPCHWSFSFASARADADEGGMWMSCPQACMTALRRRLVLRRHRARIGQRRFPPAPAVRPVGPDEHDWALAVFHHANDAVTHPPAVFRICRCDRSLRSPPLSVPSPRCWRSAPRGSTARDGCAVLVNREQRRQLGGGELLRRLVRTSQRRSGESEQEESGRRKFHLAS